MKDEIKEILDYLKNDNWYPIYNKKEYNEEPYKLLLPTERNILLDYITNLQKSDIDKQLEIMKLKDKLEQQRKEYQETYKDVRIEIKEKNEIITNLQQLSDKRMDMILKIEKYCIEEESDLMSGAEVCEDILKLIGDLKDER